MPAHPVINPAEDITAKDPLCLYLGTHRPWWLWDPAADFEMCVSHNTLAGYLELHPATHSWFLDSGAFTKLRIEGRWPDQRGERNEPIRYVQDVDRFDREIGRLDWAAPQDWVCEPWVISGGWHNGQYYRGTGLSVAEHQARTVANFLELTLWWPEFSDAECPFMPTLQGWLPAEYMHCAALYADAGVDLSAFPVVGLGSVCRRQGTAPITELAEMLTPKVALHGFGVKTRGLLASQRFTSADSLAWSYGARYAAPLPGHEQRHKTCSNCLDYARQWRTRLLSLLARAEPGDWAGDPFLTREAA